nr:MAG TPA: hypothetical protein [Caudoviricetes sp.]
MPFLPLLVFNLKTLKCKALMYCSKTAITLVACWRGKLCLFNWAKCLLK